MSQFPIGKMKQLNVGALMRSRRPQGGCRQGKWGPAISVSSAFRTGAIREISSGESLGAGAVAGLVTISRYRSKCGGTDGRSVIYVAARLMPAGKNEGFFPVETTAEKRDGQVYSSRIRTAGRADEGNILMPDEASKLAVAGLDGAREIDCYA